jgi:uncharacterized protein YjiS (DUF1127 family)
MTRIFRFAYNAVISVQQKRLHSRLIQELDERTLRDIGLESEANAARERTRLAFRFGGY